jgi:AraC family L-rhamnose operon transcriptional activator RhaR
LSGLRSLGLDRSDIISHLTIVLGHLARAVAADRDRLVEPTGPTHPAAVVEAMRLLDSQLAHSWTLTELADQLHLSPRLPAPAVQVVHRDAPHGVPGQAAGGDGQVLSY